MMKQCTAAFSVVAMLGASAIASAAGISGVVMNDAGEKLGGVMITALDAKADKSITVFTDANGSFSVKGLAPAKYEVRARLLGLSDAYEDVRLKDDSESLEFTMSKADDYDLEFQRTGDNLFSLLKWESEKDRVNFKMMCMYCHQVGTLGFRTPEEPVDWDTMVRRMQGFGGLYDHTQEILVAKLLETYGDEARESWPEFVPPPAPSGKATAALITRWGSGKVDEAMVHDLELAEDERIVYAVDMINDSVIELNTETGEENIYAVPGGKDPATSAMPRKGPHSIERDSDGNMWITLALSGEMAKFDVTTKEFLVVSSNSDGRPRGAYPHSLRIDKKGVVWYTDAGMNAVFSLDPSNENKVTKYELLSANQARGTGKGESSGITPYGISVAPDGTIWFSKLNGNRIGRIDPNVEGGDIKEWIPPFVGPRRLHVAANGLVWVPGFGDGVFGSFDPATEEWDVYQMPRGMDEIPYALNIHPDTGDIWICGTGSDTLVQFIPGTKEMIEYPMPSRVTYTREIEFASDGAVWTCNSNYPVRHVEEARGSFIKIEVPGSSKKMASATD